VAARGSYGRGKIVAPLPPYKTVETNSMVARARVARNFLLLGAGESSMGERKERER
jgi:hypothetical protein